jgi:hypothetical protein
MDLRKIRTYPIRQRKNLVTRNDFVRDTKGVKPWGGRRFRALARSVVESATAGHEVLVQIGAHVIKTGQSLLLIELMEKGLITHLAMNGACAIHDFEMALIGETSESVAATIEDGSFGMAKETAALMNGAINRARGGFGCAVGRMIEKRRLPYREYSLLAAAYRLKLPATVHVAIGTDIIHQHPSFDGARTGAATHKDFLSYCDTVTRLGGGCFLNIGSAMIGPEVFLKALSIARNLGCAVHPITTANLDVRRGLLDPFYRPIKNIIVRPVSLGGQGYNFVVNHRVSIPSLHRLALDYLAAKQQRKHG